MKKHRGNWYGDHVYVGLHYDLHGNAEDTTIGAHLTKERLRKELNLMAPDFVQTDTKGHPGYAAFFSTIHDATCIPNMHTDPLRVWREATREMGVPLHCHYSGVWDTAAGEKHPEWAITPRTPQEGESPSWGAPPEAVMSPFGEYTHLFMIPQLKELVDEWNVDGFWVDGEIWAVKPDYRKSAVEQFLIESGLKKVPVSYADADWARWMDFLRRAFENHVAAYVDALHQHAPGVKICSNWLYTFRHPGEPRVHTDWISGDNQWVWGMDDSRCEARFISTRGRPWDIMLWAFYSSHGMGDHGSPWNYKPAEMLMQEAAVSLSLGGRVQFYEHPHKLRDGRLVPWRMRRLGRVAEFVKKRRDICLGTEPWRQIAVLHSEHHLRKSYRSDSIFWDTDIEPVRGAVFALLEKHYGVDILDEWALAGELSSFPLVVVPERHNLSENMVSLLIHYVKQGGRLLISGAKSREAFGEKFLGVQADILLRDECCYIPLRDEMVPREGLWGFVSAAENAEPLEFLGSSALPGEDLLEHPWGVINRVGKGMLAFVPGDIFRAFCINRYPQIGDAVKTLVDTLAGDLLIPAEAPRAVDIVYRKQGETLHIHLINRSSGIPNTPENGAIDEIPPVGPVSIRIPLANPPEKVSYFFEGFRYTHEWNQGILTLTVSKVGIHAVLGITPAT